MTADNARNIFAKYLLNDTYIDLGNGTIVEVETFAEKFSQAPENPMYNDLVELDAGMGYVRFFNICKADGILV